MTQHPLLRAAQQLVAPVDRRPERPVPGRCVAGPGGQHRQRLLQLLGQPGQSERLATGGGQLDGQRQAVEPRHDPGHRRRGVRRHREGGVDQLCPVGEQPHPVGHLPGRPGRLARLGRPARLGHSGREGTEPQSRLTGHADRLPARREDPHLVAAGEQQAAQAGDRIDDVLAVVQHQHPGLLGQHRDDRLHDRSARPLPAAQARRHRRRHLLGVLDRGELHHPDPRIRAGREPVRDLGRHPGLADPSRTRHGDEPVPLQRLGHLGDLAVAPDETRQRRREHAHAVRGSRSHVPTVLTARSSDLRPACSCSVSVGHLGGPTSAFRRSWCGTVETMAHRIPAPWVMVTVVSLA